MIEKKQLHCTKEILLAIAKGTDPINGEKISDESFLNDPQIIRCFYYTAEILEGILNGVYYKKNNGPFQISEEQKKTVVLPEGKIGVNDFAKCINNVLDISSKKLTGMELNKKLKQMNILAEIKIGEKTNTIVNDNSHKYGFEMERRSFNGREYDKVLMNDFGKKYLIDNIEKIMSIGTPA